MFRQKGLTVSRFPLKRVLLGLAVVVLVALAVLALLRGNGGIDTSTYQLVKLNNGESYVGKLAGLQGEYATLSEPFIYQAPDGQAEAAAQGEIQLLRVSSINGDLRLATDKIVYWGNLPKEGRVVNAIRSSGD